MRISDWSSDVCSSDLLMLDDRTTIRWAENEGFYNGAFLAHFVYPECTPTGPAALSRSEFAIEMIFACNQNVGEEPVSLPPCGQRSEEHTSELQSLMRISYAVFCLKKKTIQLENTAKYNLRHQVDQFT